MSNSTSPKSAPGKFTPTRASRRLSGKPALYEPLDDTIDDVILPKRRLTRGDEDDEEDTLFMGAAEAAVTSSSASPNVVSRFRIEIPDVTSSPLSEEEKVVLAEKVGENFLEMMEVRPLMK